MKVFPVTEPPTGTESPIEDIMADAIASHFPDLIVRKQEWVGRYRVDFLCPEYSLIIECDGGQYRDNKKEQDWKRQLDLENMGYRVLRFTGKQIHRELVHGNGDEILRTIKFYANHENCKRIEREEPEKKRNYYDRD